MKKLALVLFVVSISLPSIGQLADMVPAGLKGKSYFTEDQKKRVELLRIPIEEVQFYIDSDIFAEREVSEAEHATIDINNGRIDIREGKMIEFLKFGSKEKCGVENEDGDYLYMRFGMGENEVIRFKKTVPSKLDKNVYYQIVTDDGYLDYGNKKWKVLGGKMVKLEFKDTFKSKTKKKVNKVKGYKIKN